MSERRTRSARSRRPSIFPTDGHAFTLTRAVLETLEQRRLLANIAGSVFNDLNGDGAFVAPEAGLAGWTVFRDANGNGAFDVNPSTALPSADVPKAVADAGSTPTATTSSLTVSAGAGRVTARLPLVEPPAAASA